MLKENLINIDQLEGNLQMPKGAKGIILFAHGSGSSRHSPRNIWVAEKLQKGGLGTLLIDLLTAEEERIDEVTRELRFDIGLLTKRLIRIVDWLSKERKEHIGLFGSSTGAAGAIAAAAERPQVKAVVSRGGRPDLAGDALMRIRIPTLLIVGGDDEEVIQLNKDAFQMMKCEKKMEIVPGATHLFEEPGTLEKVADLTLNWFQKYL